MACSIWPAPSASVEKLLGPSDVVPFCVLRQMHQVLGRHDKRKKGAALEVPGKHSLRLPYLWTPEGATILKLHVIAVGIVYCHNWVVGQGLRVFVLAPSIRMGARSFQGSEVSAPVW